MREPPWSLGLREPPWCGPTQGLPLRDKLFSLSPGWPPRRGGAWAMPMLPATEGAHCSLVRVRAVTHLDSLGTDVSEDFGDGN